MKTVTDDWVAKLVAYARRGIFRTPTYSTCIECGRNYRHGEGGHTSCPTCHQLPPSLEQLLENHDSWPGHQFVWDMLRDRWVLVESVMLVTREEFRSLLRVCRQLGWPRETGEHILAFAAQKLGPAIVRHEAADDRERGAECRAAELADRCTELERTLHNKRAECDELRDRLGTL